MKYFNLRYTKPFCYLAIASIAVVSPVFASTSWVGSADYSKAPGADGLESTATNFSQYDFGVGASLVKYTSATVDGSGNVSGGFTGYYQTKIKDHAFAGEGVGLVDLKTSGASGDGSGFELTLIAQYSGFYTHSTGFGVTTTVFNGFSGSANLYFDTTPDFNFSSDTGFGSDAGIDSSIFQATINGGGGSFMTFGSTSGVGGAKIEFDLSGISDGYDHNVFGPDNIGGGSVSVLLSLNTSDNSIFNQITNGNNSVLGQQYIAGRDLLIEGNGVLELTAVPLPATVWFLASGLVGLVSFGKRKKDS